MQQNVEKPAPSTTRRVLSWVLRIGLFALPMYWLSQKLAWRELIPQVREVGLPSVAAAGVCVLASVAFATWRWAVLLRAYGARQIPSFASLLWLGLVGMYFNLLPSGVGGDALRAYRLRHTTQDAVGSFTVVVMERVCGLVGLMLVAAAAMAFSPQLANPDVTRVMDVTLLAVLVAAAGLLGIPYALARSKTLAAACARIPWLGAWILRIPPAQSVPGLLGAAALSVATQTMAVMMIGFLLHPMPLPLAMAAAARMGPVVILLTYIPITPGALGQREAVFTYFFGLAGVPAPAAVVASLLFFACLLALAALGGVLWLLEKVWDRPRTDP